MSIYQKLTSFGQKFFSKSTLFKYGFNLSPMYARSTAKVIYASEDLMEIKIKLPISWKNRNYVNSIFGGSMFSAVDPIPMVQLINLLDSSYIVWDKSAKINFRRPAKEHLYATFTYTDEELEKIKADVKENGEIEIVKNTRLMDKEGEVLYCEVGKTIYVADKEFFKEKRKNKASGK